jgi:hypothetical protein
LVFTVTDDLWSVKFWLFVRSCLCCSDLILFFSFSSNYNRDKVNDYLWYSVRDRGNLSIYILKLSTKSNIQGNKKNHIKIEWKLNFYRYFPNMQISKFGCLNWLKKCSTNHWLYLYYSLKRMRKRELNLNNRDKNSNIRNNGKI